MKVAMATDNALLIRTGLISAYIQIDKAETQTWRVGNDCKNSAP